MPRGLRLDPTAANVRYAEGLRAEIHKRIQQETFCYSDYFPDSPRAKLFGHAVSKVTVGQLLREHLRGYEHAAENGQLSPSTLEGYRKIINGHLIPQFDKILLRELGPATLREWIGGLGATAKTARNILSVLRSVLDDALNDELVTSNPLDKIRGYPFSSTSQQYVVVPWGSSGPHIVVSVNAAELKGYPLQDRTQETAVSHSQEVRL